jgi:hypothetical protein
MTTIQYRYNDDSGKEQQLDIQCMPIIGNHVLTSSEQSVTLMQREYSQVVVSLEFLCPFTGEKITTKMEPDYAVRVTDGNFVVVGEWQSDCHEWWGNNIDYKVVLIYDEGGWSVSIE